MKKTVLAAGLSALLLSVSPVAAATISFSSCTEPSLCGVLTVQTTLTAGVIDVHVYADSNYGIFGDSGNNLAFGFNVVGSEAGLSIFDLTPGFTVGNTDQQISGFGDFEYTINGPHTGNAAFLPLDFSVSRTGGFFSDLDLFEMNAQFFYMAAHLGLDNGPTGFVAVTSPPINNTPVPEPASMILLGTGLLAAWRKRRT